MVSLHTGEIAKMVIFATRSYQEFNYDRRGL